jgi:thiamine pyrophosphokinase
VPPHVVIGDQDSLAPELRAELESAGTRFVTYPPAKDETDLELALAYAVEQGAREIFILGILGSRLDQTLANLLLLTLPDLADIDVRIVAQDQVAFVVRDEAVIEGEPGDVVSLIPLRGDAVGVTIEHVQWPLHDETLRFGSSRSISNVLLERHTRVRVREGILLCAITRAGSTVLEEE